MLNKWIPKKHEEANIVSRLHRPAKKKVDQLPSCGSDLGVLGQAGEVRLVTALGETLGKPLEALLSQEEGVA